MLTNDSALAAWNALGRGCEGWVETFQLQSSPDEPVWTLTLVLVNEQRPAERFWLCFQGVQGLNIRDLTWRQCVWLEIESMRGRQWERVRYRVGDVGEDYFDFWCHAFEFEVRAAAGDWP